MRQIVSYLRPSPIAVIHACCLLLCGMIQAGKADEQQPVGRLQLCTLHLSPSTCAPCQRPPFPAPQAGVAYARQPAELSCPDHCTVHAHPSSPRRLGWLTHDNLLDACTYVLQAGAVYGYVFNRDLLSTGGFSVLVAAQLVLLWTRLQRYLRCRKMGGGEVWG